MAKMKKNKKTIKKGNFFQRHFAGLLTALGITATAATSLGAYELHTLLNEQQLEESDKDKLVIEPIEENEEEKTIEEGIKETIDEDISFEKDEEEIKKVDEEEIKETESLEISKDKEATITSYSLEDLVIPIIKNFETVSVVDALNEVGYDSSIPSRARLAVYFKIVNSEKEYDLSGEQNTLLLEALRQYARDYQVATHQDYAKVLDTKTIENSTSGNYEYSNIQGNNNSDNNNQDNKTQEKNKSEEEKKDDKSKKHKHKWSKWEALDDEKHQRKCPKCGKEETEDHKYGEWVDNGDDTKSKTCDTCGYTITIDYTWGEWEFLDNEKEQRVREDGKVETRDHSYTNWKDKENGDRVKKCSTCGHELICSHDKLDNIEWIPSLDGKNHIKVCPTCDKEKTEEHKYGKWVDNGDNTKSGTCDTCGYTITIDYTWGEWEFLDDEKEQRVREDGKIETRDHSYTDWEDKENGNRVKKCSTCGHELICSHDKLDNIEWIPSLDGKYHIKVCPTCDKEKTEEHKYGKWVDNGDNTKSGTCDTCGYTITIDYNWGEWEFLDDEKEQRVREDGKIETRDHSYTDWEDKENGDRVKKCSTCGYELICSHDKLNNIEWLPSLDGKNHIKVCPTCDKEIIEQHNLDFNNGQGDLYGQVITYTCLDCKTSKTYKKQEETLIDDNLNELSNDHCKKIYWVNEEDENDIIHIEYKPHEVNEERTKATYGENWQNDGWAVCNCGYSFHIDNTKTNTQEDEPSLDNQAAEKNEIVDEEIKQEDVQEEAKKNEISKEEQADEQKEEEISFDFDFQIPTDEYEFMEEEPDVDFQPPEVLENTDLIVPEEEEKLEEQKIQELDQEEVLQLEDKSLTQKENTNDIVANFDKDLYKSLYQKKVALEQILATSKGIEREKQLELLNNVNLVRMNMVQDLAESLVKKELSKDRELIFKI